MFFCFSICSQKYVLVQFVLPVWLKHGLWLDLIRAKQGFLVLNIFVSDVLFFLLHTTMSRPMFARANVQPPDSPWNAVRKRYMCIFTDSLVGVYSAAAGNEINGSTK